SSVSFNIEKKGSFESSPFLRSESKRRRIDQATACPRGARLILPAARHRVQTFTFWILPSTMVRTTCRFGFHVRRVLLLACDTLLPNATPLPQVKHLWR